MRITKRTNIAVRLLMYCAAHQDRLVTKSEIAVYAVPHQRHSEPTDQHPLLLSYIDVVVQGYLRAFGEEGAERFFTTTDGWDAPILNDRSEPRYPRHQKLKPGETRFVDDRLQHLSATIINTQ